MFSFVWRMAGQPILYLDEWETRAAGLHRNQSSAKYINKLVRVYVTISKNLAKPARMRAAETERK